MRTFRGHMLHEVAWAESLSTMIFDLPRSGIRDLPIPLSPSIFKRVWPETIRSTAFHLTDLDGIRKLNLYLH